MENLQVTSRPRRPALDTEKGLPVLPDENRGGGHALPELHEPALKRFALRSAWIVAALFACTGAVRDTQADSARFNKGVAKKITCRISRISDGDSLHCGAAGRIRLLLIDAPELSQGAPGNEARRVLEALLPKGTLVSVETDVRARDPYNRILGYVYLSDGRMANEEMARSGYVTTLVYPPNVLHVERIRKAVDEARRARRGLWASDFFDCAPRDYRAGRCGTSRPR